MSEPISLAGPPPLPQSEPAPVIPVLPENATPEEKDLHWFRHVYQGDKQRQLTWRAVLMGGVLGMFMSISNLYTTLKLGWSFGVAITSCVLSFVIWKAIRGLSGGRIGPMAMLENNCMQSTASAAGYSTGGTVGTAFAALFLIENKDWVAGQAGQIAHHQPLSVLVPFVFFTAALGVFLAIPMKRQMINHEQLPFPDGIAAAETLRSLYSHGIEAMRKAWSLIIALAVAGVVGFIKGLEQLADACAEGGMARNFFTRWRQLMPIPELINLPGPTLARPGLQFHGLGFEPGVLMIGAGMIMGLRAAVSMLLGSVLLYYVVTPFVFAADAAHVGAADWHASFKIFKAQDGSSETIRPWAWGVWGGTTVMVVSSLAALGLQWKALARAFRFGRKKAASTAQADALAKIEVPLSWLIAGVIPIGLGLMIVLQSAFGVSLWLGFVAVALTFALCIVACRATGETNTTPIGAMGKVTQLLFAVLAKNNTTINLMSAGATAAAAGASADLLSDLKSGYLLGANPRRQFIAQFIGVFFGTVAVCAAWRLMIPTPDALNKFPLPAANAWRAMADLLAGGVDNLPLSARWAVAIGAVIGLAIPLAEILLPKQRNWIPSAMGLGLGFIVPFANSLSFTVGAIIVLVWSKWNAKTSETYTVPIASGLIAGEGLVMAIIAITSATMGIMAR